MRYEIWDGRFDTSPTCCRSKEFNSDEEAIAWFNEVKFEKSLAWEWLTLKAVKVERKVKYLATSDSNDRRKSP